MKLLIENWRRWALSEAGGQELTAPYENMQGLKYLVDLENLKVIPTQHTRDQQKRHLKFSDESGRRAGISRNNIIAATDRAMGEILTDFANGEIENNERFVIRAKQGNLPILNVVCSLGMKPGPDTLVIHTVMRKDDFKTDRFAFKGRPQKEYPVSIQ